MKEEELKKVAIEQDERSAKGIHIERINFTDEETKLAIEKVRNQIQAFQTRMKNRYREEKLRGFIQMIAAELGGFTSQADEDELWHHFNQTTDTSEADLRNYLQSKVAVKIETLKTEDGGSD